MQLIDRIEALTGVRDRERTLPAVRAVAAVLFEQLWTRDRVWLEHKLPFELRTPNAGVALRPVAALDEFFDRIARREGMELSQATELARSTCRALSESLTDDDLRLLQSRLPDALHELFVRVAAPSRPASSSRHPGGARSRTLADGRPGSRHPLSESAPPPAHGNSVARSDNPHADDKLSSSRGTTQEREAETLAEGEPGSHVPQRQ